MTRAAVEARLAAHPVEGTPRQMRAAFEALMSQDAPPGTPFEREGVPGLRFGTGSDAIWLHGGGYVFGSSRSHAAAAAYLAKVSGYKIWVPDYRLAPEAVWPAQYEDAAAVDESFEKPVPVIGDSAGGHLALNLARSAPRCVSALVLISPNTDRSGLSQTRQRNSTRDLMNSDRDDTALGTTAMAPLAHTSVQASPLLGDLSALPPIWITASTHEVLLDDTLMLIRAMGLAGASVDAQIRKGLFHLWPLWPTQLKCATDTLDAAARFLKAHRPS